MEIHDVKERQLLNKFLHTEILTLKSTSAVLWQLCKQGRKMMVYLVQLLVGVLYSPF